MPEYEYQCVECGKVTSEFFRIADKPEAIECSCGAEARKILSACAVQGDEMPVWMRHPELRGSLQSKFERPYETRGEYKKLLKERNVIEHSVNREF